MCTHCDFPGTDLRVSELAVGVFKSLENFLCLDKAVLVNQDVQEVDGILRQVCLLRQVVYHLLLLFLGDSRVIQKLADLLILVKDTLQWVDGD